MLLLPAEAKSRERFRLDTKYVKPVLHAEFDTEQAKTAVQRSHCLE